MKTLDEICARLQRRQATTKIRSPDVSRTTVGSNSVSLPVKLFTTDVKPSTSLIKVKYPENLTLFKTSTVVFISV